MRFTKGLGRKAMRRERRRQINWNAMPVEGDKMAEDDKMEEVAIIGQFPQIRVISGDVKGGVRTFSKDLEGELDLPALLLHLSPL